MLILIGTLFYLIVLFFTVYKLINFLLKKGWKRENSFQVASIFMTLFMFISLQFFRPPIPMKWQLLGLIIFILFICYNTHLIVSTFTGELKDPWLYKDKDDKNNL